MKHILMVDDNTTNLKVAAQVLQPFYQLSMAKSGKQALSFLKKNKPDLILLDINMPEKNGYETLEEIKLNPDISNIPVIFLTASNDMDSEVKGMKMGALDYITKPFEEQVMLSRIEKVLQMEEMRMNFIDKTEENALNGILSEEALIDKVDELIVNNKLCLIYVDFDRFSNSIHTYGDNFASPFIKAFTDKLEEVFAQGFIANISDDSFVIVFVRTDDSDIEGYLNYISYDCAKYAADKVGVSFINCCAVATLSGNHGNNYDSLFRTADKGMYYVKKTDGISTLIYDGR